MVIISLSNKLCFRAAAEDDCDALTAWYLAGANFSITDHENRSPMQVVSECNIVFCHNL